MRNTIIILFATILISSCSQNGKKNWITYGTGAGVGMGTYTLVKSWLGKSGTGGNLNQVIAITTLGTLAGVFMGSEIAENMTDNQQEVLNVSMEREKTTTWSMIDENSEEVITKIEPKETVKRNFGKEQCKKFDFSIEEKGMIKRGQGFACNNPKSGNWEMLGVEML